MRKRKLRQCKSSRFKKKSTLRFKYKRLSFEDIPLKTMRVTLYALRWLFLLIFIFIICGIFILFVTGGQNHMQNILGYSITGFFTFFMGYFGWILAQSVIEVITGKEDDETPGLSYYLRRSKRSKRRINK